MNGTGNGADRGQPGDGGSGVSDGHGRAPALMTRSRDADGELTIGIVGPHDLVERIMLADVADTGDAAADNSLTGPVPARRMVAAAYRDEHEAADKIARLAPVIDSWLFASPVPLELARRAGVLAAPATCVPLGGSALYAALLLATRQAGVDLARASVDVLSRAEVAEAYAELRIPAAGVHVRGDTAGAADLASFHDRLWREGRSSVAFTCLQSVAARLASARLPVITLRPTGSGIRSALRTAALLGINRRLEAAQLAIVVVEVPALRDSPRRPLPRPAREELRLTVHRFLVQEAQQIRATVSPLGDHGFLIAATRGSLAGVTDRFRVPPFAARAQAELGIGVQVGVGTGRDAAEAEARARAALDRGRAEQASQATPGAHSTPGSRAAGGGGAGGEGNGLVPAPRQAARSSGQLRGLDTLARLAAQLPSAGTTLVIDAETAGRLIGVTPRTARRLLHTLVEEGLAWPLPPSRPPQPGRPRQAYRLLVEKLPHRTER